MPFFTIFYKNITTLMRIFDKKRTFSKENTLPMPIFCQKNVNSLKNTVLSYQIIQIFMKNPLLSCLYLVKKTSILSKLH